MIEAWVGTWADLVALGAVWVLLVLRLVWAVEDRIRNDDGSGG